MADHPLVEKVVRVVDYQTSPNQSDWVSEATVTQIVTQPPAAFRPSEVRDALKQAVEAGLLNKRQNTYQVAK